MAGRFLLLTILFLIAIGLIIHFQFKIPYLPADIAKWIGHLPGDLIIKKEGATIYVPITTSLLVSAVVSFVLSIFFRSGK